MRNKKFHALDVLLILPAIIYLGISSTYSRNIPQMDDYDAILKFLLDFRAASFIHKLGMLFRQHNEHRLLFSRIVYVLEYWITGGVNFRFIIFFGDLNLIVAAIIGCYFIKDIVIKYWQLPAAIWMICLFDLNTYEAGSWAMCGVANYGVIMLFMLSLLLYRKHWIAGAVLQALCIFSNGNGMLGGFFIFASTWQLPGRLKRIVSGAIAILMPVLYFIHYIPSQNTIDLNKATTFFIRMLGAPFSFNSSMTIGLAIIVMLLIAVPYKQLKQVWPLLCILGFALASMGTASIFRSTMGSQFQASRYLIFPEMAIALIYLFVYVRLEHAKHKWIFMGSLTVLVILTYHNNYSFGKAGFERVADRADNYPYWYPDAHLAATITDSAAAAGIYNLQDNK